jgi:hypothetical protein
LTGRASTPTGSQNAAKASTHVGYVVNSPERTTAEMEAAGHPPIARIHSFGAAGDGAAAYYDTADALASS